MSYCNISFGLTGDLLRATAGVPLGASGCGRWRRRWMSNRARHSSSRFRLRLHVRLVRCCLLFAPIKMIGGNFKLGKGGNDKKRGCQKNKSKKCARSEEHTSELQ